MSSGARLVYDGNSLSTVSFGNYPAIVTNEIVGPMDVGNVANVSVAGKTTAQLITDAPTTVDPLVVPGKRNIVIFWEITNDIGVLQDATQVYNNVVTYCQARQAAGSKVIVLTGTSRSWGAGLEAILQTVNTNIRDHWSTFADGMADVANAVTVADTIDGTHFGVAGNQKIAAVVTAALLALP